ncbi:MAG: hybrid sensor histidine kinase/response regulator [Anaerolineales bacterium]|nr:hybrid sensor histidine kinase/response regulator [Anaerolineales bacterium]
MENKPQTILVIDDEPALLQALAAKIKRKGYSVITAVDGNDGYLKAQQNMPDLILSDVMMPPPNGLELRRLLSLDPQLATIPFIFLTARTSVEDRVSGLEEGADDYITKPFETEELLARIAAVLRRVQAERQAGRDEMKALAEQSMNELKKEILQNFHHELRTPLTNILMPLQLIADRKLVDPEEQVKFVKSALSNADRLESLVTDLILLSNMDQGNLNSVRQPLDFKVFLRPAIQKRFDRYSGKHLNFTIDLPERLEVAVPRREFVHAIIHLLDNAFKFNEENGSVHFRSTIENGDVTLFIQDNGKGIPPELREKVFERFYQISQGDNRDNDGMGVGLPIARAVFATFGGSVEILESQKGCTVKAVIPKALPGDLVYG